MSGFRHPLPGTRPLPAPRAVFDSLAAFYGSDARRGRSREVDCGAGWHSQGWLNPRRRVTWVVDTGELITVDARGRVELLATIPGRIRPGDGPGIYQDLEGPGAPMEDWELIHPDLDALRVQLAERTSARAAA